MSIFTSLGILLMVVLIQSILQLAPGVFAHFYHYASGKYSTKKARLLSPFFILGIIITNILMFVTVFCLVEDSEILRAAMAGVFVALALVSGAFYYRRGAGTRLYIPRILARAMIHGTQKVKGASDAFVFGVLAGFSEIIFTLPLAIMVVLQVRTFDSLIIQVGLTVLDIALSLTPVIIVAVIYRTGGNLADIIRFRVRNKNFNRAMLFFLFLLLAAGIYNFGVL